MPPSEAPKWDGPERVLPARSRDFRRRAKKNEKTQKAYSPIPGPHLTPSETAKWGRSVCARVPRVGIFAFARKKTKKHKKRNPLSLGHSCHAPRRLLGATGIASRGRLDRVLMWRVHIVVLAHAKKKNATKNKKKRKKCDSLSQGHSCHPPRRLLGATGIASRGRLDRALVWRVHIVVLARTK